MAWLVARRGVRPAGRRWLVDPAGGPGPSPAWPAAGGRRRRRAAARRRPGPPATRLRRGRPLWVLVGLLLGLTAGGGAAVLVTLQQPAMRATGPRAPAAAGRARVPAGGSDPSTGWLVPRLHGTSAGPVAAPAPSAGRNPAGAGDRPHGRALGRAGALAGCGRRPLTAAAAVLYSGSGHLDGAACLPADCSSLTSPSAHVQYELGHTSCGASAVITLTLTSSSANKSTFTVSDRGSTGRISGQAAPFHVTGPFFVRLQTSGPCAYDLTITS